MLVGAIPLVFRLGSMVVDAAARNTLQLLSVQLAGLVALGVALLVPGVRLSRIARWRLPSARAAVSGTIVGIGLPVCVAAVAAWLDLGATDRAREVGDALSRTSALIGTAGLVMIVAVISPLIEEAVFRGVILEGVRTYWRSGVAVAVSALLFGLMHGHPAHVFITGTLGVFAGLGVVRGGSIWVAVLMHAVNNAVGLGSDLWTPAGFAWAPWMLAPGLALVAGGTLGLIRSGRQEPGSGGRSSRKR